MHPISEILCGVYKELLARGEVTFALHDVQRQNLDAVVKTVEASYFGVTRFETSRRRAASYFCYLIKNHPLIDGNKRLAVLWLQIYCDAHQLTINPAWTLDVLAVAVEGQEFADDALLDVVEQAIFDGPATRARFDRTEREGS